MKNEKTTWEGLWFQREGLYNGKVIKKADIPTYARLIVRYNKYYDKDTKRPRFVYCFANGDAAKAITMKRDEYADESPYLDDDGNYYTEGGERLYTEEEVQDAIDKAVCDAVGHEVDSDRYLVKYYV